MATKSKQLPFSFSNPAIADTDDLSKSVEKDHRINRLDPQDRSFHDWYRFVLSFPPHLVRTYIAHFGLTKEHVLLDPFCGTGTTIVEAKLKGIAAIGIEANPFALFASEVKTDWGIDPDVLLEKADQVALTARKILKEQGIDDNWPFETEATTPLRELSPEAAKLIILNSISPMPLHKTLVLLECLTAQGNEDVCRHGLLALANALVFKISNLHFGPEVGVGKAKANVPVITAWLAEIKKIAGDLRRVRGKDYPAATFHLADARQLSGILKPRSVDAVITSPPYPNEKDYTRTTRLESVILGLLKSKTDLRNLKSNLIRSNTRGVYKNDDDDLWIADHSEIQHIAEAIEKRRRELGKNSGFEKLYGRVTRLYFGGMARHLAELRTVLRPGAQLAYVVGDQASYLRIMIRTGRLLADIAQALGYKVERIDLFRTRFATATKEQLREEVVVLRWTGQE